MFFGLFCFLWGYCGFVFGSVKCEFQLCYCGLLFGVLWMVFNLLLMIVVYMVIFFQVMCVCLLGVDDGLVYSVYFCVGLLIWGLFVEIILCSQSMFIENVNLLKKISFLCICLLVIVLFNVGVNFVIIFVLFFGFFVFSGCLLGVVLFVLVLLLVIQVLFVVGLGMIFGVFNVFFCDVGQLFGICLQFWFWLMLIVYLIGILFEGICLLIEFNLMIVLMCSYQQLFFYG